jgi:formate C-acetyltransferase
VGRYAPPTGWSQADWDQAGDWLGANVPWPGGQTGHCELDLSRVLSVGIDGLGSDIAAAMADADRTGRDTLQSFLDVLEGLSGLLETAADTCETAMSDASPARGDELSAMRDACLHVARRPPRTMQEALQLFWAIWLGCSWDDHAGCINLGHIDRWLYPFYQADLAEGRIDRDGALELLEQLYLLTNACWPKGSAIAVMVGGRDARGADVTNELSYLCLEALRRTRLSYPTVGICRHEGTPRDLCDLAIELISDGIANPAFFSDEVIQRGLRDLGVPAEQACNYINSSCVEITPVGASGVWVASPYFSVCKLLLEEIDAQTESTQPVEDFESFLQAYLRRTGRAVDEAVEQLNATRRARRERGRHPLQSVFTRDCIARGRDVDDGGAIYNWIECSFVGLANLVDSLEVIRREVFETGHVDLARMRCVLDENFASDPQLRRRWLEDLPKYGQDEARIDRLFQRVSDALADLCKGRRMEPDDAPFVPGAFCWIKHEQLGSQCGATPDGRLAHAAFADGCGPAQGRETKGPTAAVLSVTRWDHQRWLGGLAYNMKFSRSMLADPQARKALGDLVLTYLRRGGFETQINVVDRETLLAARAEPEKYRDLVVRIGGYTDYFTRLQEGMQDEIIARAEMGF